MNVNKRTVYLIVDFQRSPLTVCMTEQQAAEVAGRLAVTRMREQYVSSGVSILPVTLEDDVTAVADGAPVRDGRCAEAS